MQIMGTEPALSEHSGLGWAGGFPRASGTLKAGGHVQMIGTEPALSGH